MLRISFYFLLASFVAGVITLGTVLWYVLPQLPSAQTLREVHLQTPLRVYTADARLMAEFGEKRRQPVAIESVPDLMKQAFVASEDDRFYTHPGVDWMAIARAGLELIRTREKKQGGSTITMQVARNFFLTREKTYERKLKEIVLAIKIERELSKDDILELYLNKIFLGHRAYGVGAAAQVYYGKVLDDLTLAEIAMIAGLPQGPSKTNPISNPDAARARREYVLSRMLKLGFIEQAEYATASAAPVATRVHGQRTEISAPYAAEMVRAYLRDNYGDAAYTDGYRVYTTIKAKKQLAANTALQGALLDYDQRHGYRGPEAQADLNPDDDEELTAAHLAAYIEIGPLRPALVIELGDDHARVLTREGEIVALPWQGIKWARPYISHNRRGAAPKKAADVVTRGDIVRIRWRAKPVTAKSKDDKDTAVDAEAGYWQLAQIPVVEGALISLGAQDGAIQALVGGFDFKKSKFNRATQALRQPGSNFKPFIYSAALAQGFTAASFVNDAPIVFDAPGLESDWRPENYSGKYYGPTPLRKALAHSRNLISIRLLRAIGIEKASRHLERFGLPVSRLPRNLSMSLGSGELTPLELVSAYAVLSNGGYRVDPYFIARIESESGEIVMRANPKRVCKNDCLKQQLDAPESDVSNLTAQDESSTLEHALPQWAPRVLDAGNAWVMNSMMRDVIKFGTGRKAQVLKREDLAGKTGTTNDQKDAWFSGFNGEIVTTVWVGFDNSKPLGKRETGAGAALPMWIDYMRVALEDSPVSTMERPDGLVTVRIDPTTGMLAGADNPNAVFETFPAGNVPKAATTRYTSPGNDVRSQGVPEQLF